MVNYCAKTSKSNKSCPGVLAGRAPIQNGPDYSFDWETFGNSAIHQLFPNCIISSSFPSIVAVDTSVIKCITSGTCRNSRKSVELRPFYTF